MTNVSKQLLEKRSEEKLFKQLAELFSAADARSANQFIYELFTPAERIMFTKRLAAILLLDKGVSSYRIAKTLKMSPTTIADILEKLERGSFTSIVRVSNKKKFASKEFWDTLEVLLRAGMPSMGKDRWKFLDRR